MTPAPIRRPVRIGRLGAAATVAAVGIAATPIRADASYHQVRTFRGTHLLASAGDATNLGSGQEMWDEMWLEETPIPMSWMTVCDYQGAFALYNPDGSYYRTNKTSTHSGCSMSGYFYSHATEGVYPENKRFTAKWISSSAEVGNQWRTIGTLVD